MGPDVLLTVRGHRSGLPRATLVATCQLAGGHRVISPCGEVNRVRNLRVASRVTNMVGQRSDAVIAVELGFPHAHSPAPSL
jgi:hypothetical protein